MNNRYASLSSNDSCSPVPKHVQQHLEQQQLMQQQQQQQSKPDHFISLLKKITLTPLDSNFGSAASAQEEKCNNNHLLTVPNNNAFTMSNSQQQTNTQNACATYQSQWDMVPTEFPLHVSQSSPLRQVLRTSHHNSNHNLTNNLQTSGGKKIYQMSPSATPPIPRTAQPLMSSAIYNTDAKMTSGCSISSDYIDYVYPLQQSNQQQQQHNQQQHQQQFLRHNALRASASSSPQTRQTLPAPSLLLPAQSTYSSSHTNNNMNSRIALHQSRPLPSTIKKSSNSSANNTIVYLPQKELVSDSKSISNNNNNYSPARQMVGFPQPLAHMYPPPIQSTIGPYSDPQYQPIMPFPISQMNGRVPSAVSPTTTVFFQPSILHKTPSGNPVRIPVRNPAMSFIRKLEYSSPAAFDLVPDSVSVNELSAAPAVRVRRYGQTEPSEYANMNSSSCSSVVQLEALEIRIEDHSEKSVAQQKNPVRQQTHQVSPNKGENQSILVCSSMSLPVVHGIPASTTAGKPAVLGKAEERVYIISPGSQHSETQQLMTHTPHLGDRSHLHDVLNGDEEISGGYFEGSSVWNNSSSIDQDQLSFSQSNHRQQQIAIYKPEQSLKVSRQSAKEGAKNQSAVGDSAPSLQTSPSKQSATFIGFSDEFDIQATQQQQERTLNEQLNSQTEKDTLSHGKENLSFDKNSLLANNPTKNPKNQQNHNTSLSFSSSPPIAAVSSHIPNNNARQNRITLVPFKVAAQQQGEQSIQSDSYQSELLKQQESDNHPQQPLQEVNSSNSNNSYLQSNDGKESKKTQNKSSIATRTAYFVGQNTSNTPKSTSSHGSHKQAKSVLNASTGNAKSNLQQDRRNSKNSKEKFEKCIHGTESSSGMHEVEQSSKLETSSDRRLQERLEQIRREKEQIRRDLKSIELVAKSRNPKKITPFHFNSKLPSQIH